MRTISARLKTVIALLALAAFLLAGCASPTPPEDPKDPANDPAQEEPQKPEEPEPPVEQPFDPNTFMTEIIPAVECMDSCALELYGAEADRDTIYHAGFDADGAPHLYLDGEPLPEGCEEDGSYANYYPVTNFSSLDEIRASLAVYLSEEVLQANPCRIEMLENNFLEYEGSLYLWRGSRGYGASSVDMDSLSYLGEADGLQQVQVSILFFGEHDYDATLSFQQVDGVWKMVQLARNDGE